MKPTGILGLGLLALSGVAVAYWWKHRGASAASGAAGDPLKLDSLPALQQVGSNFQENVTPDIVKATFDYAERQTQTINCWRIWPGGPPGFNYWYRTWDEAAAGAYYKLPAGQFPQTGVIC